MLDTGPIETTPDHLFFTTDRGWIDAADLEAGEGIRTATGSSATVVGFTLYDHPASMWDITVAGAHSFFVGSGEVAVHNCITDPFDQMGSHVIPGHTPGGAGSAGNSIFNPGEDLYELMRAAGSSPRSPSGWNFVRRVDAGRNVGTWVPRGGILGPPGPTTWYTVITDAADRLITMFPGLP